MLRLMVAFLAAAPLAGCHGVYEPGIERCESDLVADLKAPSTYKRINASAMLFDKDMIQRTNRELEKMDVSKDALNDPDSEYLNVSIEYDAENSFGVPLRGTRNCRFAVVKGKPDYSKILAD